MRWKFYYLHLSIEVVPLKCDEDWERFVICFIETFSQEFLELEIYSFCVSPSTCLSGLRIIHSHFESLFYSIKKICIASSWNLVHMHNFYKKKICISPVRLFSLWDIHNIHSHYIKKCFIEHHCPHGQKSLLMKRANYGLQITLRQNKLCRSELWEYVTWTWDTYSLLFLMAFEYVTLYLTILSEWSNVNIGPYLKWLIKTDLNPWITFLKINKR